MAAPNYSPSDFASALSALFPRGLAWPRSPDAVMQQVITALSPVWARHVADNNYLLVDAFPSTTVELLPEWEASLGLPDPCAGESPSLAVRQAQVVARFTNTGGQSIAFFTDYAKNLGFTISVSEFTPFRAGQQAAGDSCGDEGWAHTWRINAPQTTINYFRAGASAAGEPLASWGNAVLLCEMNTLKPAHTLVIVANPGFLDIDFRLDITTLA
ncbi:YmfQ family protein [Burkholderia gladioli]|uniref:YmfQ family protein n=1 Tax=Burkholderia gladioli TaxID=28095 RepID=UPI0005AA3FBF|nr:putative phage tail protein [Burkholderia gladioli]ASD79175.1 phage tail protein [Burkholderia gladioli pv. gladioli]AWY55584.1 phage tail protein [Burkholderia gladioli pv. gladioli]